VVGRAVREALANAQAQAQAQVEAEDDGFDPEELDFREE
jgi:hypothetical protein